MSVYVMLTFVPEHAYTNTYICVSAYAAGYDDEEAMGTLIKDVHKAEKESSKEKANRCTHNTRQSKDFSGSCAIVSFIRIWQHEFIDVMPRLHLRVPSQIRTTVLVS